MRYITELEHKVQTLQTEATTLSAQLTLLQVRALKKILLGNSFVFLSFIVNAGVLFVFSETLLDLLARTMS